MHTLSFHTILGSVTLKESDQCICELVFRSEKSVLVTPLLRKCEEEIQEYLSGKRKTFSVPLTTKGTEFDAKVLKTIQAIGFGKTETYAGLAKKIGSPKAFRAVANACGRNRLPILIPCHRVVASSGLGGYNGGTQRKKQLLALEHSSI